MIAPAWCSKASVSVSTTPAAPVAKLDRAVLTALADKVLTSARLKEMLRELKARLKKAQAGQDDRVRNLQRELTELGLATNRLYEAVEKGILPMDDRCPFLACLGSPTWARTRDLRINRPTTESAGKPRQCGVSAVWLSDISSKFRPSSRRFRLVWGSNIRQLMWRWWRLCRSMRKGRAAMGNRASDPGVGRCPVD